MMCDLLPKYKINSALDESKMKHDLTTKCRLSEAIKIEICETFENAESAINRTFPGIVIDLREEEEKAFDSMRINSELVSNEIDESDLQYEKHSEQRI
jgi:hypothetical protein